MSAPAIGNDQRTAAKRLEAKERIEAGQHRGEAARREARAKRDAEESERLAAREAKVEELLAIEIAALPADIRDNAFVLSALRNKANIQAALNAQYDIIHRAEPGSETSNDALKTTQELFKLMQAATTDVLSKWPKPEENRVQRIPKSVMDWIEHADEYEGPIVVQADGN